MGAAARRVARAARRRWRDTTTGPRTAGKDLRMRSRVLLGIALVIASAGCARVKELTRTTPMNIERPAADGPGQFQTADGGLNNNSACPSPLVDPRDKTSIALVRSRLGYGDYRVPA